MVQMARPDGRPIQEAAHPPPGLWTRFAYWKRALRRCDALAASQFRRIAYITRDGALSAETEQGIVLTGREGLHNLQTRWLDDVALDGRRRRDGTLSVNLILSMPPGPELIKVWDAEPAFVLEAFDG